MPVSLKRRGFVLFLTCLAQCCSVAWAAELAGRSVADALAELSGDDLQLIYNDQIVPPGLRVLKEPAPGPVLDRLRAILAAHGLGLRRIRAGVYAVVEDPDAARPAGADASERQRAAPPGPMPELVVTTSRYELLYDQPGSHDFLSAADVNKFPRAADETLRVLHRLPGTASAGVAAPPHIRGGEQAEIMYLLDGLQLYEPFHGKQFLNIVSIFDSRFVESIDFYSGGYTANFGDRMSGVVDISSLAPPETTRVELGLNLFHTSALGTGRFAGGRGDWLVSLRRSNLDEIADLTESDYGEVHYYDALFRVGYELTPVTRIALNYLHAEDSIGVNTSGEVERAEADYKNDYAWATLEHDWSDEFSGRLILSLTDVKNSRDGGIQDPGRQTGRVYDRRAFDFAAVKLDFSLATDTRLTRWGVEARQLDADYRYVSNAAFAADFPFPGDPARSRQVDLMPKPEGYQLAAYLTSRFDLGRRWTAELGLRWDDQDYDGLPHADQWSPRLNLQYALSPATQLSAAVGRYYQTHGIHQLQVEDGVDHFFPAQRADHLILALDHEFDSGMNLRLEAWYKDFDRLRPRYENLFDPLSLVPELQADRIRIAPDSAAARGVELSLARSAAGPWSWWLNYSWSRVTDDIDGRDVPRSWDQRHSINLGLNWATERWDVTLTGRYHTGWPTTEVQLQDGEAVVGPRNDARFDDFRSVDLKVARSFDLGRSELELFLDVTNVFMFSNPCCVTYEVIDAPDGSRQLREDLDDWPRIVPNLGVYWRF